MHQSAWSVAAACGAWRFRPGSAGETSNLCPYCGRDIDSRQDDAETQTGMTQGLEGMLEAEPSARILRWTGRKPGAGGLSARSGGFSCGNGWGMAVSDRSSWRLTPGSIAMWPSRFSSSPTPTNG